MLKRIGRMGHRQIEQGDIGKGMADRPLQRLIIHICLTCVAPSIFASRERPREMKYTGRDCQA